MTSEEIVTTLREYDTDAGYAGATLIESQAQTIAKLQEQLKNLAYDFAHAEMEIAEKDKERLDWIEASIWRADGTRQIDDFCGHAIKLKSIRAAIDAAMTKGENR